jgi:hypothetical protein
LRIAECRLSIDTGTIPHNASSIVDRQSAIVSADCRFFIESGTLPNDVPSIDNRQSAIGNPH